MCHYLFKKGVKIVGKNQHVVKIKNIWGIRGEGNSRITSLHQTQQQAIIAARKIAKNQKAELIIHGRDGKIRDKDSFGPDPCPPKDNIH